MRNQDFQHCHKHTNTFERDQDLESVPLAMGLSGQKLLGVPIVIQPSQAEKNRVGMVYSDPLVRHTYNTINIFTIIITAT